MNFAQFLQLLKRTEHHALFLITGQESYLRRQAIQDLVGRYVNAEARQLSFSTYGDAIEEIETGLATAQTWPMASPKRVVLISGPAVGNKAQVEMIAAYFQHPSSRTVIVLEAEDLRKDSALLPLVSEHGVQVDCQRLKPQECNTWLQQHARAHGFTLLPEAAAALYSCVGNNLQELAINLDKLMDYIGEPGRIARHQVLEVVGQSRELPLWELSDAVTKGDSSSALNILDSCLRQGEAPLVLLAVISKVFRQVILARELIQLGAEAAEIGKSLRIPEFKLAEFLHTVKSLPDPWARDLLAKSAEIDNLMKSSSAAPRTLLEMLICRAAFPHSQRQRRYSGQKR
jgi:DNA polymerase III subunit delta